MAQSRPQTGMTRLRMLRMGAGALAAAVLGACGPLRTAGPDRALTKKEIALTHWTYLARTHPSGEAHIGTIEQHAEELRARLGVNVTWEVANTQKAMVAAAGGTPPHTAWLAFWDGARLLVPGMTVDPDEELKRVKEWAAQRKDIFPGMLETSLWRGKLTSIPLDTNNRGIYYDKAVLAKAGIAPPTPNWTRDEFTQKVIRASAPPERWGFTVTAGPLDFLIFYGAAGGKLMNNEQTKWTVDSETGRETLRYLHELIYARQTIPAPPPGEMMRTGEGKVAFDITGNFRLETIRQARVDVGAAPIPFHRARYTIAHGSNIMVFKVRDGDAQHAAARFAMWMNSPTFQVSATVRNFLIPVSKATLEHKDFQQALVKDPVFKVFADQAPYAWRIPTFPSERESENALGEFIKKALLNEIGINEALTEGQRAAQLILDEDLKRSGR